MKAITCAILFNAIVSGPVQTFTDKTSYVLNSIFRFGLLVATIYFLVMGE